MFLDPIKHVLRVFLKDLQNIPGKLKRMSIQFIAIIDFVKIAYEKHIRY